MKKERYKIRSGRRDFVIILLVVLFTGTAFDIGNKKNRHPIVSKQIEIRGIYGSPEPFWKKNIRLNELGVNAIFLHHGVDQCANDGTRKV